jgi:hypothetical protein
MARTQASGCLLLTTDKGCYYHVNSSHRCHSTANRPNGYYSDFLFEPTPANAHVGRIVAARIDATDQPAGGLLIGPDA